MTGRCTSENGSHEYINLGRNEAMCGDTEECRHCGDRVLTNTDELRAMYALTQAQKLHAEKYHVDYDEVQVLSAVSLSGQSLHMLHLSC